MISQALLLSLLLAISNAGILLGGHGDGYGLDNGYGIEGGESYVSGHGISIGHEPVVEYYAPPKYEFKYGVQDYHTGDLKEQDEARVGDLTKSNYALHEKDRKIQVSRIISGAVPVKIISKKW